MTHHERYGCCEDCRAEKYIKIVIFFLALIGAVYTLTGCTQSSAQPPQVEAVDETLCNAKYANWIIRHEELSKPQPEQYHNFKRHMGECVR